LQFTHCPCVTMLHSLCISHCSVFLIAPYAAKSGQAGRGNIVYTLSSLMQKPTYSAIWNSPKTNAGFNCRLFFHCFM